MLAKNAWSLVLALSASALVACGPAAPMPEEQEVDGPEPDDEAVAHVTEGLTVSGATGAGCSTTSVRGLSEQIVAQMNCILPNAFAAVPSRPNLTKSAATFAFMQTPARDALVAALDANPGKTLGVNSMLRTVAQQYVLYRWGQTKSCGVALAARPGRSNHESGLALDTSQYSTWRSALESRGFKWFGSSDRVHFDYRGSGARDQRGLDVKAFQMLWNANHPGDRIAEDGDYGPATESRLKKSPAAGFAIGSTCAADPEPPPDPEPDPPPTGATGRAVGVAWDLSTGSTPSTGTRLPGAVIALAGGPSVTARSGDAFWSLTLPTGSHTLTASASGFETTSFVVDILNGKDTWASIGLLPGSSTSAEVVLRVVDGGGQPLPGAIVHVPSVGAWVTGADATVKLTTATAFEARAYADGFDGAAFTVEATDGVHDLALASVGSAPTGRLQGVVWDRAQASSPSTFSARLPGAIAICSCGRAAVARSGDAYWKIDAPSGTHEFTFVVDGYRTENYDRGIVAGSSDWGSIGLTPQ